MNRTQSRWTLPVVLLSLVACAHREPAPIERPTLRASTAPSAQNPSTPAAATAADDSSSIDTAMFEHFVIVNHARDAVIGGRLGVARRALGALAEYRFEGAIPGQWTPWIEKVQRAAKAGARAVTLEEAAAAVANTAALCGECHAAQGTGPGFPDDYDQDTDLELSNSLIDRMERHVWSANRMWEGLIGPSDNAWRAGGTELAKAPHRPPHRKPAVSAAFGDDLRALRELGDQARSTDELGDRVKLYTRFLARCARCHQREHVTL